MTGRIFLLAIFAGLTLWFGWLVPRITGTGVLLLGVACFGISVGGFSLTIFSISSVLAARRSRR